MAESYQTKFARLKRDYQKKVYDMPMQKDEKVPSTQTASTTQALIDSKDLRIKELEVENARLTREFFSKQIQNTRSTPQSLDQNSKKPAAQFTKLMKYLHTNKTSA